MRLGLDLSGGVHIVLQAKGTPESPLTPDSIDRLLVVLRSRIDQYGIVEPIIQREGDDPRGDRPSPASTTRRLRSTL